jgi:IS605 OrfB family transposase
MIKSSKHNIHNITNEVKLHQLNIMFDLYKKDLIIYINYIIDEIIPLKTMMSSSLLPNENIKHSRYKQLIYKQASEIIRSQIDKAKKKRYNKYKKIYSYMMERHPNHPFVNKKYSELNINNIINTKYFTKPNLNNISINLDERFFDIKQGKHFDNYVKIILPFFNDKGSRALQIKIPIKHHKHSNKLKRNGYSLRNNIQLKCINNEYYINLVWYKEDSNKRTEGSSLGLDMGYKKLITSSDGKSYGLHMEDLYKKISNKKQGSKNFKQSLNYRDNEINRIINNMDLTKVKSLIIEDLNNVKYKSKFGKKFNNKLQRWSYAKTINKIERICMEKGIMLVKVSPAYTSQTCSSCGNIDKESRKLEEYKCISCGYEIDADVNASINIHNRGVTYSPSDEKKDIFL